MSKENKAFSLGGNTLLVQFETIPQANGRKAIFAKPVSELDARTLSPIPKRKIEAILKAAIQWKVETPHKQPVGWDKIEGEIDA